MKQSIQITHRDMEVLDFVASRLLYFKRIDYAILLEVLDEKFQSKNSEYLLQNLMQNKVVKLENEQLVAANNMVLTQLTFKLPEADLKYA